MKSGIGVQLADEHKLFAGSCCLCQRVASTPQRLRYDRRFVNVDTSGQLWLDTQRQPATDQLTPQTDMRGINAVFSVRRNSADERNQQLILLIEHSNLIQIFVQIEIAETNNRSQLKHWLGQVRIKDIVGFRPPKFCRRRRRERVIIQQQIVSKLSVSQRAGRNELRWREWIERIVSRLVSETVNEAPVFNLAEVEDAGFQRSADQLDTDGPSNPLRIRVVKVTGGGDSCFARQLPTCVSHLERNAGVSLRQNC